MTTDTSSLEQKCETAIDGLYKTIYDQQAEYDKQLLTLSSALLGVSLVFVKDVVPLNHASYIGVLYVSWGAFAICILAVLFSFQMSIHGQYRTVDFWKALGKGNNIGTAHLEKFAARLTRFNWLCGVLFLVGVFCLTTFVIINVVINHGEETVTINKPMSGWHGVKDGAPIRVPSGWEEKGAPIKVPNVPAVQPAAPSQGQTGGSSTATTPTSNTSNK